MSPQESDYRAADASAAVLAAVRLWTEIERARNERDAAAGLVSRLADTLELVIRSLPANERDEYQRRLDELRGSATSPDNRGGEVYGNVIELFRRHGSREWSIPEIQAALGEKGEALDSKTVKAIYNTINYFAKTGRLQRISRGRYLVRDLGAGLDVAEDIGDDGTTRPTEHDN